MLESIRSRAQGTLAKIILALITVPFALWGVDSYLNSNSKIELVAEVGEASITRQQYTVSLEEQAGRMRQALGPAFDKAAVETPAFREQVLNGLVDEEALLQEAQAAGLRVTDAQVASVLQQIEVFQKDGKFSEEHYKNVLKNNGHTAASYESRLRREVLLQTYQQPLVAGALAASGSVELVTRIAGQRREVSWLDIASTDVAKQVQVSDKAVQDYYAQHKNEYMEPEAVRVEFVVLSLDGLVKNIQISDKQIQDYFAANAAKLGPPEERSASHILIAAAAGDAAARKQAKIKAEALLVAVTKAPKTFAEVAKRESQDSASAVKGGSLGGFTRGLMVKPFENAVFSMKPSEVRVVETEYGFHVIRLDGVKSSVPTLASVKAQIEMELRKQQAQKLFSIAAEDFDNLLYEQPDSLKPAADKLKLTISTSGWMTRQGLPTPPFNEGKLLAAVFATNAIKNKQNTKPVEIGRNEMVAARVIESRPAKQKTVTEVAAAIREKLLLQLTTEQSEKNGQAKLAEFKKGVEPTGTRWSAFQIVGRQQPGGLDQKSLQKVMRLDGMKLPAYTGAALPDGGYRIIRVTRVMNDVTPNPMLSSAIEGGLRQAYARADMEALVDLAKATQKN